MRTLLFAVLLCCLPGVTEAGEVPAGFQGLAWGATPETFTQRFPAADCQPEKPGSPVADIICRVAVATVIGVKTQAVILKFYVTPARPPADGFSSYTMYFSPTDFSRMALAIRVLYGEPLHRAVQRFRKRAGLHSTNTILTWEWSTVQARLERFAGRMDRSLLTVGTLAGQSEALRRIQVQRQPGARAF